ncbi:MAG: hypothetical protein ACTSXO_04615 [Candidatus Heimdallarchaeota archaeon]
MRKSVIFGLLVITMIGGVSIIGACGRVIYDPPPPPPSTDSDNDGLSNTKEREIGTDPYKYDTDGDGIGDYLEYCLYHTNPLLKDTDGDSLEDKVELQYGFDPNFVEATHMFVHDGKVYCGVAYVAWVSDYWLWYPFIGTMTLAEQITFLAMLGMLDGDLSLDALDGSDDPRYNYVAELESRGYYVITDANFGTASYIANFIYAFTFAQQYNTRLFVITYTHGMPLNTDIPSIKGNWMTYWPGFEIGPSTFEEMAPLLFGSIPELVFYAAPCFSMTTMSISITQTLLLHTSNLILFGTFNSGTQSAVWKFLNYGIKQTYGTKSVYDAYQLSETQLIGFLGSKSYVLPTL